MIYTCEGMTKRCFPLRGFKDAQISSSLHGPKVGDDESMTFSSPSTAETNDTQNKQNTNFRIIKCDGLILIRFISLKTVH